MLIGVDFDNTIVRYDDLFHRVAFDRGLIPADLPATKNHVRDYLRAVGNEDAWTEMQGEVYGARMGEAPAFEGAIEFMTRCVREGIGVRIVSHKTRHPFKGPKYDLHQSATDWLTRRGFFSEGGVNLSPDHVYFGLTKEDKLRRIGEMGCTHFVDDLPEFLSDAGFPAGVERILFDPANSHCTELFFRVGSWNDVEALLFDDRLAGLPVVIRRLLGHLGYSEQVGIQSIVGGANNRVFRLNAGDQSLLLKAYFRRSIDERDRLRAEFEFSKFAWESGVRSLPRPIGCDPESQTAVYEFIQGDPIKPGAVSGELVRQAVDFYLAVNGRREAAHGLLGPASEARFSLAGHVDCVNGRVEALAGLPIARGIEGDAAVFVREQLRPAWTRIVEEGRNEAHRLGAPWEEEVPALDRRLSPSDFGFHNALLGPNGHVTFFDFEYAGWDDPAKLVCDFFCQPAVPVPVNYRESFIDALAQDIDDVGFLRSRIAVLWPVYRIKWICIMLNDFLPAGSARRRFAQSQSIGEEQRKSLQLAKARARLQALADSSGALFEGLN